MSVWRWFCRLGLHHWREIARESADHGEWIRFRCVFCGKGIALFDDLLD